MNTAMNSGVLPLVVDHDGATGRQCLDVGAEERLAAALRARLEARLGRVGAGDEQKRTAGDRRGPGRGGNREREALRRERSRAQRECGEKDVGEAHPELSAPCGGGAMEQDAG
jgi:hypothetical protein